MQNGRAIRQALADANPRVTQFQRDLAISLIEIGHQHQAESHAAEAAESYRKALPILQRIPLLAVYDQFNVANIHSGLAGVAPMPGSGLSPAEGQAEANRAMTWIRKAVDGGYRPPAHGWAAPELNRLRSRSDFQDLMMDLSFPKDPFARGR